MSDMALVGGVTPCWNCGQPMRAGAERCLWCGVALADAPSSSAAVPTPAAVGSAGVGAAATAVQTTLVPAVRPIVVPGVAVDIPARAVGHLPAGFAGSLAGVGRQAAAWAIDVAAAVGAGVAGAAVSGSVPIGVVVTVEVAAINWIAEARAGLTLGNLITRTRSSRADVPFSPGAARAIVQRLLVAGGFVVGIGVGALVVVASGVTDNSGERRSWADRAAGMRRVVVPTRAAAAPVDAIDTSVVAAPFIVGPAAVMPDDLEISDAPVAPSIAPAVRAPAMAAVAPLAMNEAAAPAAVEEIAPLPGVVAPHYETSSEIESTVVTVLPAGVSMLLLVFDTGQREQVPTPATINLGRNPTVSQAGDHTIIVQDPESTVSKNHVRIEHSRGQTWVVDLGSTNGTKILADDGAVTTFRKNERGELEEGARVRIGNRTFTVSLVLGGDE